MQDQGFWQALKQVRVVYMSPLKHISKLDTSSRAPHVFFVWSLFQRFKDDAGVEESSSSRQQARPHGCIYFECARQERHTKPEGMRAYVRGNMCPVTVAGHLAA